MMTLPLVVFVVVPIVVVVVVVVVLIVVVEFVEWYNHRWLYISVPSYNDSRVLARH